MKYSGEWGAPVIDELIQRGGDWDAILEIVSTLLGRQLLSMPRDAIQRENLAPHSIFATCI